MRPLPSWGRLLESFVYICDVRFARGKWGLIRNFAHVSAHFSISVSVLFDNLGDKEKKNSGQTFFVRTPKNCCPNFSSTGPSHNSSRLFSIFVTRNQFEIKTRNMAIKSQSEWQFLSAATDCPTGKCQNDKIVALEPIPIDSPRMLASGWHSNPIFAPLRSEPFLQLIFIAFGNEQIRADRRRRVGLIFPLLPDNVVMKNAWTPLLRGDIRMAKKESKKLRVR